MPLLLCSCCKFAMAESDGISCRVLNTARGSVVRCCDDMGNLIYTHGDGLFVIKDGCKE